MGVLRVKRNFLTKPCELTRPSWPACLLVPTPSATLALSAVYLLVNLTRGLTPPQSGSTRPRIAILPFLFLWIQTLLQSLALLFTPCSSVRDKACQVQAALHSWKDSQTLGRRTFWVSSQINLSMRQAQCTPMGSRLDWGSCDLNPPYRSADRLPEQFLLHTMAPFAIPIGT